ncbi:phage tail protein [Paenibacillus sp. NPDC058367]|uniref:phage tail protein n=1 Tax=Paenibacillus sp. NPDC058367 TaxID=3346460 RepID=UPI003658365F
MSNRITIDTSALNRVMRGMRGFESEVPAAVLSALNRTIDHVFTKSAQEVTKRYNIKNKEVKETMYKQRASLGRINAFVRFRGKRFTLGRFLPGGLNSTSKVAKVKIKKSAGYQRVGGEPKAFVQKVTGRAQVMRREGRRRYPVDVMRTIATAQMVENEDVQASIQTAAATMLSRRMEHEIERRLRRTIR